MTDATATRLDGRALAKEIETDLSQRVAALIEKTGRTPILATILVGDDPASATYVRMKGNACKRVGMESIKVEMPASTTTEELLAKIDELNNNPDVHGILLQHPVPEQIDERACFDAIDLNKDVDGVTSLGFGRMSMGEPAYGSCTPQGIMYLLEKNGIEFEGKNAVVVGRSAILGKPMAQMLLNANCTVTTCHSRTQNLAEHVGRADIIVGAVGVPELIKKDWIKPGVPGPRPGPERSCRPPALPLNIRYQKGLKQRPKPGPTPTSLLHCAQSNPCLLPKFRSVRISAGTRRG